MGGEVVYGETLPSHGGVTGLLLAAAVVIAVVYLLAYRSLLVEDRHPLLQAPGYPDYSHIRNGGETDRADSSPVRTCANCGAENEGTRAFDYCRVCTEPLRR